VARDFHLWLFLPPNKSIHLHDLLSPVKVTALFISRKKTICNSSVLGFYVLNYYLMFIFVTSCMLFYCVSIALLDCQIAGFKSVSGRSCDRPPRHKFFLVSLCLKANAEMVPKTPSWYCMFSCSPTDWNFSDPYFMFFFYTHYNRCHRATAHSQLHILYYIRQGIQCLCITNIQKWEFLK